MKKKIIALILIALTLFALARLYYRLTDDFRHGNITHDHAARPEWETPPLSDEEKRRLATILNQPYHYIDKGAQSYAFGSADGKYVLKFFKFKHLRPSLFQSWLPPFPFIAEYRDRQAARKKRKFEGVFAGYHLANQVHKKESGLIYIHLNPTKNLFSSVTVFDKIGRKHFIQLDEVVFILQKRAQTMRAVISEALSQGNLDLAKKRINQILDLYLSEYKKGIFDHDHGIMHNAGFAGKHPIHLDVGKLKSDANMRLQSNYAQDLALVARRMDRWLKENSGENYQPLKQHIEQKVSEITEQPFVL